MSMNATAKRVLLIGWDAADWKVLSPMMDAGQMPALSKFVSRGVMGNIQTLRPALSPILWNSIATGKRPDKHGICGFIEPTPDGNGVRPTSSTSRKTKAIWNILSQSGKKTHVVGWYASHPAEPINGICVSKPFAQGNADPSTKWAMPAGAVYPPELEESIKGLRVHTMEMSAGDIRPFIPQLETIDQTIDGHPRVLADMLARAASTHAVATAILENEPWDFMAVYYDLIDLAGHYFMPFHPPKMAGVSDRDFELYQRVMTGVYRWHDMLLARLLALAGEDALVVLVSDHGFQSDHLRPATASRGAHAAAWHRQYGVFAMAGPGVLQDERIYGATLLDVTPTILTAMGLPIGQDMDGKALVQAFDPPLQVQRIPSWDEVSGESGMHPPELRVDPISASEAIKQLVELGYMEAPTDEQQGAVEVARREWQYNLAASYLDAGKPTEALPILESLYSEMPSEARFGSQLAHCYRDLNRPADCRRVVEALVAIGGDSPAEMDLLLGWALFASGENEPAMEALHRAERGTPHSPALHCMIGRVYARQHRWEDAHRAFARALEIDPESEQAHDGMAMVLLERGEDQQAAEHALRAVGLTHFFPIAHYRLGVALVRLGQYERAADAMKVAVAMRPGMLDAHRYLGALYGQLGRAEEALVHRQIARRLWDLRAAGRASDVAVTEASPAHR
jgi:predicted AlkP superfamily phosphohydrolase/phosphomutase/Flp pilus assembly protein TadD